jgi:hypothetical protein
MADDDPIPIEDALLDLDEEFLLCRDLHHSWPRRGADYTAVGGGEVERVLVCQTCGTERVDRWTLSGQRVGARYYYPDGYQFRNVDGATDRGAMRREVLRRAGVTKNGRRQNPTRRRA